MIIIIIIIMLIIIISVMTCADQVFHNKYLHNNIFSLGSQRYTDIHNGDLVAKKGLLRLLQLKAGYENDLAFTHKAMDRAARNGHLPVIKWLHTNRTEICPTDALNYAAMHGHLEIVKWLHANCAKGCTMWTKLFGAVGGHPDTIQWLNNNIIFTINDLKKPVL